MSSVDLNIIERGIKGQQWTAQRGPITTGDLAKIIEQRTNNSSALNALPTPFARFFVVKEAFRRVLDELKDSRKAAGDAYNRLVSDTLDVFELLYNISFHSCRWPESRRVEIREWDYSLQLSEMKKSIPILAEAVSTYFNSDLKATGGKLYFVILIDNGREYLLATSSPFTGFMTPPDLDKKIDSRGRKPSQYTSQYIGERYKTFPIISRKSSAGNYFREVRLFGDRDKDFKNYMFYLVNNPSIGSELEELRDYIKQVQITDPDIIPSWKPQVQPIVSKESSQVVINGLPIYKDDGISTVNFFNECLVRLPFRLSENFYHSMTIIGGTSHDYDYLLPISTDGLEHLEDDFECVCKDTGTKVTVILKYRGQEYTKEYRLDPEGYIGAGRIINLKDEKLNFNLAVFPNILSTNREENNFFKVMAVLNDSQETQRPRSIEKLNLSFFSQGNDKKFSKIECINADDNKGARYGVHPAVIRSKQDSSNEVDASSSFYEVFNTPFHAINLRFGMADEMCEGLLYIKWNRSHPTSESYTYAVDLGTTNTYISCVKNNEDNEPEQLRMIEPMVAFLHDSKKSNQHSFVKLIEEGLSPEIRKNFTTELLPALIDGDFYKFPIRTALCVAKGDKRKVSVFDNCNIAFFYEKAIGLGNQSILTDIKWEGTHEKHLRTFIQELLLIIKANVLQKNGVLSSTKIIWFRPLSFKGSIRELYTSIWKEEAKRILNIGSSQIQCVSESEAPYYYFNKKNIFNSVDAVSIVDIGGGSCDFIYFADGKPQIANSVHFGCDTLWSNGFSGFDNDRSNGIFKKLVDNVHLGSSEEELEQLNIRMRNDNTVSTKDIINFWLSNDNKSDVSQKLKGNYKPLFLYHFASIVYFMAKMYRVKNLPCPRAVLFCGNGSKYIDGLLSSDETVIKQLVTAVFKKVYGNNISDVQVILPDSRKECTCYGGLYRNADVDLPEEFNFQGVAATNFENVGQLKDGFSIISKELFQTVNEFNDLYKDLLNILIANREVDNKINVDKIVKLISEGVDDSIRKNFKKEVIEKMHDSEIYHDSLFFLPIIDNVFKLTQI